MTSERRAKHSHSRTAEATAAMRALESLLPAEQRLLHDPVARELVRRRAYSLPTRSSLGARLTAYSLDRCFPGLHGHVILRCRYADEAIIAASRHGVEQIVLLGAGFDATAYRLDLAARLFDVDVPITQRAKLERLARAGRKPRMSLTYVECRLGVDDLGERLRDSGFNADAATLFVWLGVVPYLTADAIARTLADLRHLSVTGSRLVLDYVESSVLDGSTRHRGGPRVARTVARLGEPLRSAFSPRTLRETLGGHGFVVEDDAGLRELAQRYPAANGPRYLGDGWNRVAKAALV